MPSFNKVDMLNCCAGYHDFSDDSPTCRVCGLEEPAGKETGWYAVTGRPFGADESTHLISHCDSRTEALDAFCGTVTGGRYTCFEDCPEDVVYIDALLFSTSEIQEV